jgi:hypothetical protein
MRRLVWFASLALVWAVGVPASTQAQVPPALQAADLLARWIEAAERSPVLVAQLDELLDLSTVDSALAPVHAYLADHAEDVFALILSVRLGGVRDLLAYQDAVARAFSEPGAEPPPIPSFARHLATLDGVLARDSLAAAAHYWMARTLVSEVTLATAGSTGRRRSSPTRPPLARWCTCSSGTCGLSRRPRLPSPMRCSGTSSP